LKESKQVIIVIPARNEERSIKGTLDFLNRQSVPPSKVIVVDDGSKDKTVEILHDYKSKTFQLVVCERPERKNGKSLVGTPLLAKTFNVGFKAATKFDFDYIMIVGADIRLEKRYIEKMLKEFERDPRLAIASGQNIAMKSNISHARGAGRMIDARFWRYYGQKYPIIYGWEDDCLMQCRRIGLKVKHFPYIHYSSTRKAQGTIDFMNWGRASRAMGYHPIMAWLRALRLFIFQHYGLRNMVRFLSGYYCTPLEEKVGAEQKLNREFMRKYQIRQIPEKVTNVFAKISR